MTEGPSGEKGTPKHMVVFQPSGLRGRVPRDVTLMEAAREIGVDLETICAGQQVCGKCRVIPQTPESLSDITEKEENTLKRVKAKEGSRLACAARVRGDAVVFVPPESQALRQIVRKSVREINVPIFSAIRQHYVGVEEASLENPAGDWQRLQESLEENFGLRDLTIDTHALRRLQETLREGDWHVTVTLWSDREVIRVRPGFKEGAYGFAVDVGTTTVAGYLCDLQTGRVIATESSMNPQIRYGEDLMSRFTYAMENEHGLEQMHDAIIETINELLAKAARASGLTPEDVTDVVLVGNTGMHHILLKLDPSYIGVAPFTLATNESMDMKARDLGIEANPAGYVHILPCEAGYVGADNVAVAIAETPYNQDEVMLILDIGTNGEILLGNREKLFSASAATGPAFEGAQIAHGMRAAPGAIERVRIAPRTLTPRFKIIGREGWSDEWDPGEKGLLASGICGSGIIEVVAELFRHGIILPTGKFNRDTKSPNFRPTDHVGEFVLATADQTGTGEEIAIIQQDIRAVQLAKGALYAGTKLLMKHMGVEKVDKVVLAGAFGSYISKEHAMIIGLFPDCPLDNVYAVGNAAGDGACMALLSREKRREAGRIARWINYVETATDPDFQTSFVMAMELPHSLDLFLNLEGLVPGEVLKSL